MDTILHRHILWLLVLIQGYVAYDYRCPQGLPFSVRTYNGRCYQFVEEEKYWDAARDYCVWHGGKLAKIADRHTNQFVTSSFSAIHWHNNGVWIGLHDIRSEMTWEWVTEKAGVHDRLTWRSWKNWGAGHPGAFFSSLRDCVRMHRKDNWRWHETFCHALKWKYRFICEYKMRATTTTSTTTTEYLPPVIMRQHAQSNRRLPPPPQSDDHKQDDVTTSEQQTTSSNEIAVYAGIANAPEASKQKAENNQNTGMVAGIVICCALVVLFVVIIAMLFIRRRRKSKEVDSATARFNNPVYLANNQSEPDPGIPPPSPQLTCCADPAESQVLLGDEHCVDISGLKSKKVQNEYVYHVCNNGNNKPPAANSECQILESDSDDEVVSTPLTSEPSEDGYEVPKATHHYLPMNGFNASPKSSPTNERSVYDQPKPMNIYAEIPGEEEYGNIYETLDSVQETIANQFNNESVYMNSTAAVETAPV